MDLMGFVWEKLSSRVYAKVICKVITALADPG